MKELEQRLAIAEACGWVNCISPHADEYHFLTDLELGLAMGAPVGRNCQLYSDGLHYAIPNYLNDLNAMHQAEKMLDARQLNNYENELTRLCNLTVATSMTSAFRWHATAAQRAEAFLHTLNLWKNDA